MKPDRGPAILLSVTALAFLVWAVLLVRAPAGSIALEWTILGVSAALLVFGLLSLRTGDRQRATLIRWLLTAFAAFGGVAVIGLTADDNSSRTWVRLGWAALVGGLITSVAAWWSAPRVNRTTIVAGGVVGLIVIAGGWGITTNCDTSLQRSWCDPVFEQEEILAASIEVDGALQRSGRAGGATGAYVRTFFIDGTSIEAVTEAPEGFVFEERPLQSIEVARGRYTATSGPDANCQIDVKVESIPAGNLQTLNVACISID
jgi:hypothetical protein